MNEFQFFGTAVLLLLYVAAMNWLGGEKHLIGNGIRSAIQMFKKLRKAT